MKNKNILTHNTKNAAQENTLSLTQNKNLEKFTFKICNNILKYIFEKEQEYAKNIELYKSLTELVEHGKLHSSSVTNILESLSMAKEFIQCDEPAIFDFDYLIAYIQEKDKKEQLKIVKILTDFMSQFFVWETNEYHLLVSLRLVCQEVSNDK